MTDDNSPDNTSVRTLWSETVLEMLVVALQRKSDREVLDLLQEIRQKKYSRDAVTRYVDKRLDGAPVQRLQTLLRQARGYGA